MVQSPLGSFRQRMPILQHRGEKHIIVIQHIRIKSWSWLVFHGFPVKIHEISEISPWKIQLEFPGSPKP